jgi:hypothetical protein
MSAKGALRAWGDSYFPKEFGVIVIQNARKAIEAFPYLSPHCLDTTLLVAYVEDNQLWACLYGDGVIVHRTKTGVTSVHIQLTSGAPDYLSYHLDPIRKQAYDNVEDNKKLIDIYIPGGKCIETEGEPFEPYVLQTPVEEGDVISVISDGINSFSKSDYTSIPWQDLIEEFTGYKNFEGEFVLRRISAFKRKCLKEGITHSDDISVATIIV